MVTETIEIRPKTGRNAILLGIGCAAFTVMGLTLVISAGAVFVGLLAILFFGGGGLWAIPKLLRRRVSMRLTGEGLHQCYEQGTTHIPWRDVEEVGITSMFGNKMVGIRLKTYDRYLGEMSPALAEFVTRHLPYLKWLARATSLLAVPASTRVWSKLEGHDVSEDLRSFGATGNLAESLLWSRSRYGYDIVLSWAELDRSAEDFVALLEGYRTAASRKV
jgi:hypothetical protein